MNYFKDNNNNVRAYDDEQLQIKEIQDKVKNLTSITEDEMKQFTIITPDPKSVGEIYTLNGIDYQIPFMKDDADGLMQVNAAFQLGVTETVIYFTNSVKMPITAAEFNDFAVWFVTKRNSFFI